MEKQDKRLMQIVGANVKMLRIKTKINQEDFADMVDLNRVSICNIESGKQGTTVIFLLKSCKIFGCELNDLIPMDFPISIGSVQADIRIDNKINELQRKVERLKKLKEVNNG